MESITKIDLTVDMVRTDLWWSNGTTGVSHALTKTSVGGHVRSRARPRQLRNSRRSDNLFARFLLFSPSQSISIHGLMIRSETEVHSYRVIMILGLMK